MAWRRNAKDPKDRSQKAAIGSRDVWDNDWAANAWGGEWARDWRSGDWTHDPGGGEWAQDWGQSRFSKKAVRKPPNPGDDKLGGLEKPEASGESGERAADDGAVSGLREKPRGPAGDAGGREAERTSGSKKRNRGKKAGTGEGAAGIQTGASDGAVRDKSSRGETLGSAGAGAKILGQPARSSRPAEASDRADERGGVQRASASPESKAVETKGAKPGARESASHGPHQTPGTDDKESSEESSEDEEDPEEDPEEFESQLELILAMYPDRNLVEVSPGQWQIDVVPNTGGNEQEEFIQCTLAYSRGENSTAADSRGSSLSKKRRKRPFSFSKCLGLSDQQVKNDAFS